MSAVADAIEASREEVFITDWFFSPQLYLKRPIETSDEWRLDKLLQRKAVSLYLLYFEDIFKCLIENKVVSFIR